MGASTKSNYQNCGNILINIKTIKNKNKIFTFHCTFCSIACDQLKKFSKHLEEEHLQNFVDELKQPNTEEKCLMLFEAEEIKVETDLDRELFSYEDKNIGNITKETELYEDPLETDNLQKNEEVNAVCVKEEQNECVKNVHDVTNAAIKKDDTGNATSAEKTSDLTIKEFSSDDFSDDSDDIDFEMEDEFKDVEVTKTNTKTKKSHNMRSNKLKNHVSDADGNIILNPNKSKKWRKIIIKNLLPTFIQQYKKYEILWKVNNIAFGIKNKKYEVYTKISENLKSESNGKITVDEVRYYIRYLNEIYSKDRQQEIICQLEKRDFVPESEFYKDLTFLSECQGPFLCSVCNEILPKYDKYCQHMAKHNGTQSFKCPSCDMWCTNYQKFLTHKKRHLGLYNFHCSICGKGYLFKNDLEWHVTSHTGDKPFLCQICGTGFRARHGYDNHIRRHEERFRHECHICKRGFNQLHALNNHVKSHLNIRDVICKICGKGFVHMKYLKRHELIHGDVKNYKCNECGKAFFQACGLRSHRKNHHS